MAGRLIDSLRGVNLNIFTSGFPSNLVKWHKALRTKTATGFSANELVKVTFNGDGRFKSIKLHDSLADKDVSEVEKLILAACADAHNKLNLEAEAERAKTDFGALVDAGLAEDLHADAEEEQYYEAEAEADDDVGYEGEDYDEYYDTTDHQLYDEEYEDEGRDY